MQRISIALRHEIMKKLLG